MTTLLLSAGDASGELHTAPFVEAFRRRVPEARLLGLGGPEMEKAGVELVVHQRELAIGGLVEVLRDSGRIFSAWRRMNRALETNGVDLVVLVDSPDFNIPLARRAKKAGIPVLYFISPQVWAWRRRRIGKIARRVDRMAVIFPFERQVYAASGLRVDFVGHPLVDRLGEIALPASRQEMRRSLGLDPGGTLVVLLPGSRRNEVRNGLSLHLQAARALHARDPRVRFAVAVAPSLPRASVEPAIAEARLPSLLSIQVFEGRTYELIRAADVALAKPGTVTVEISLLGTPMVVAARANPLTAFLARRVVRLPSFAMPNLIVGAPVVPEFLQEKARPERIGLALAELIEGPAREVQLAHLRRVRQRLGSGGAAERAAAIAEEMACGAGDA
jgi:lipid-A-disaccharide synthase